MFLSITALSIILRSTKSYLPTRFTPGAADVLNYPEHTHSQLVYSFEENAQLGIVGADRESPEGLVKELMRDHGCTLARRYLGPGEWDLVIVHSNNLQKFNAKFGIAATLMSKAENNLAYVKRHFTSKQSGVQFFQTSELTFMPANVVVQRHADNRMEVLSFALDGKRLPHRVAPVIADGKLMWRVLAAGASYGNAENVLGLTCPSAASAWDVIMTIHKDEQEQKEMRHQISIQLFGEKDLPKEPRSAEDDPDWVDDEDDDDDSSAKCARPKKGKSKSSASDEADDLPPGGSY
ncbi:hypothetical protein EVB87_034 [Rhizobium phage RHph_N28_1]|nr:hypothetical protein EVB87_034 [Rhizobium phage RHph_N28_1]QIG74062.1 hypothetical protein EVC07_034 [Rhizobium phage RHph_N42]